MSNMEWKDTDTDQLFVHSDHRPIYSSLDIYTGGQFDDDFPALQPVLLLTAVNQQLKRRKANGEHCKTKAIKLSPVDGA